MAQIRTSVTLFKSRDHACTARLSNFCCSTHFVRREDVTYVSSALRTLLVSCAVKDTVYVGGYNETDKSGILSPMTAWRRKLT